MQVGDRLKSIRKEKKLTLKEVSNITKISLAFLSDIERCDAKPSLDTLTKLAEFYKMTLAELLAHTEESRPEKIFPTNLLELQKEIGLSDEWMNTLSSVQYRGNQPNTKEEWYTLYLNLKQLLEK